MGMLRAKTITSSDGFTAKKAEKHEIPVAARYTPESDFNIIQKQSLKVAGEEGRFLKTGCDHF
jgi:hypothetical protein